MADGKDNEQLKYFNNQPFDMEMKISHDEDDEERDIEEKEDKIGMGKGLSPDDEDAEPKYTEAKIQQTAKPLPKFDISKFEDIKASPEAKELLSLMKR